MSGKKRLITKKGQSLRVMKNKPKKNICYKCKKKILEKEKYVIVGTYIGIKERETFSEYYYHLDCWVAYFNECVLAKFSNAQKEALKIINESPLFSKLTNIFQKMEILG